MAQLFLIYDDHNGENHRISVSRDTFIVGRHPDNDLPISSSKLSREHIEILRNEVDWVVEDVGSTNGTKLNDVALTGPEILFDGDILDLGGGVQIRVQIGTGQDKFESAAIVQDSNEFHESSTPHEETPDVSAPSAAVVANTPDEDSGSDFGKFFIIAAILLFMVLAVAGITVFLVSGTSRPEVVRENDPDDFDTPLEDDDEDAVDENTPSNPTPVGTTQAVEPTANTETVVPTPEASDAPTPKPADSGNAKLEQAALGFLRRIATNDPRPVLTSRQMAVVKSKIDQLRRSGGLTSNIKNANTNAQAISSLARSKNLKPQFLAVAAIARLGGNRGDVLSTSRGMIEVLDNLNIQIGDELADESLVTIAAYQQGVAGEFLKMRNTMRKLADENPSASPRQIRSIWFLRDKGKLSNAQFDLALRFLAIGTITQNPKAFGVSTEALKL